MSGLPEPLLPFLANQAAPAASELLQLTQRSGDLELLSATADLWQRILTATPADHPDRAGRLSNLGVALQTRFGRTGAAADLDAAIAAGRQAVDATPADHPGRAVPVQPRHRAAVRFGRTGAGRGPRRRHRHRPAGRATATPADHPDRAGRLSNLGTALQTRFERTGATADLDAAIDRLPEAVDATPADHPDRGMYLSNLGTALQTRFDRTGAAADLDAAITAGSKPP